MDLWLERGDLEKLVGTAVIYALKSRKTEESIIHASLISKDRRDLDEFAELDARALVPPFSATFEYVPNPSSTRRPTQFVGILFAVNTLDELRSVEYTDILNAGTFRTSQRAIDAIHDAQKAYVANYLKIARQPLTPKPLPQQSFRHLKKGELEPQHLRAYFDPLAAAATQRDWGSFYTVAFALIEASRDTGIRTVVDSIISDFRFLHRKVRVEQLDRQIDLYARLASAVHSEQYEQAAHLRDTLRKG